MALNAERTETRLADRVRRGVAAGMGKTPASWFEHLADSPDEAKSMHHQAKAAEQAAQAAASEETDEMAREAEQMADQLAENGGM